MTRFQACLAETLRWEGRWSDHPADRGGPTMAGIIITVWAGHRGIYVPKGGYKELRRHMGDAAYAALVQELRNSTAAEREPIWRKRYWDLIAGDELPPGVDMVVFDFAVNSGVSRATRLLQQLLGISVDGHMGAATIAAANAADPHDLARAYMTRRRAFLRGLKDFVHFGKGWMRRCDGVERVALAMVGAGGPAVALAPVEAQPLADSDAQSATQGRAVEPPKTAVTSSTVRNMIGAGGGGTLLVLSEINRAAAETRGSGLGNMIWLLASSWQFWVLAAMLICIGVAFRERIRKIITEGV